LLGLDSATVPSDNVIDPQKTIPRATLWGTLVATIVYVLACTTVLLLVPGRELANSNAPFADALRLFWGDTAANTLALFAFISGFGALNGWILIQGEMPRVLAREGIFPRVFARESRFGTPGAALFITSTLVTPVVLSNYADSMVDIFSKVILIATDAFLVMYLFCSLAALKLAWRGDFGLAGKQLRRFLIVAATATAYSLWTLYGAGTQPFLYNLVLLGLGLLVYVAMKLVRRNAPSSSVAPSPP
jgi:APA family basic amino acid/polyamine antiporter